MHLEVLKHDVLVTNHKHSNQGFHSIG